MKYQISSIFSVSGTISGTGARDVVQSSGFGPAPFRVVNAGPSVNDYDMKTARFGADSNLKILSARAMPILAPGLREGLRATNASEPAIRMRMYCAPPGPITGYQNIFLTKFNDWQPADAVYSAIEGAGWLALGIDSFNVCYDSYKIKTDYVGKSFAFRFDLIIETSGGVIDT